MFERKDKAEQTSTVTKAMDLVKRPCGNANYLAGIVQDALSLAEEWQVGPSCPPCFVALKNEFDVENAEFEKDADCHV